MAPQTQQSTSGQSNNPLIFVSALSYAHPGAEQPALRDLHFEVRRGEIFGLLGPSGAGKSTLQRILTRQIRRFETGSVSSLGRDIKDWGHDYFERIGVGFELPNHYLRLTGKENLEFFASLYASTTAPPERLLEMVGLEDAAGRRVADFSKGMMVRLNFARALLHDPELVFLDEPTTGLDPTSARRIKTIISDLKTAGKTIILTTHNMHDADELCDRVGFIVAGAMNTLDAPENLKARYGERRVEVVAEVEGKKAIKNFPLDGLGDNEDFRKFLSTHAIRTIHSQEASLEKVFAKVTGVTLGPEGGAA